MTRQISVGEIIPLRSGHSRVDELLDAVVPARADHPVPANDTGADLGNVVPFMRPRGSARTAPAVALPADAARRPTERLTRERLQPRGVRHCVACSACRAVHGVLARAGAARKHRHGGHLGRDSCSARPRRPASRQRRASSRCNAAAAPETEETQLDKAEEKATAQPQTVEVGREETAPEQKTEQPKAESKPDQPKFETAAAPQEPAQAEQKPAVAMVETPAPDTATAKPQETPPPPPLEVTLLPQPEEKPVEKKAEPKPVQAAPPKPVKDAKPAKEPRRIAAPTRETPAREAKASNPSTAANNVGVGRSDRDTNYPGLVSAHLRRHQQYPSDARSRGDQGTATVSFGLDGGGRVTSARLVRGSGVASIDQEVQAMVRRASPFPAPPDGRPRSFTVPVAFRFN